MKKGVTRMLTALLIVTFMLGITLPSYAAQQTQQTQQRESVWAKLGRGLKNILTGWTKVPEDIAKTSQETNPVVGVTGGTVKGAVEATGQTATGVAETATFPLPDEQKTEPSAETK